MLEYRWIVVHESVHEEPVLDLDRAPYVCYGVKYIDLVTLAH